MNEFLIVFVRMLVICLWALILGRVLMSWVDPRMEGRVGQALFQMTEPLLAPVRRVLPQTGMFDLAPLIVLLVLGVFMRVLV